MAQILPAWTLIAIALSAFLIGCAHKTDPTTELEKAANLLAKAEPALPTPEPAPEPQAPAFAEPAVPAGSAAVSGQTPSQCMRLAISAYKAGELEDVVTRLQKLRATPTLTAQQRMAVQDGVAAVMTEIYTLASKGNTRAIQAVQQYEQMQTMRH
jgi:hypothetical protein